MLEAQSAESRVGSHQLGASGSPKPGKLCSIIYVKPHLPRALMVLNIIVGLLFSCLIFVLPLTSLAGCNWPGNQAWSRSNQPLITILDIHNMETSRHSNTSTVLEN